MAVVFVHWLSCYHIILLTIGFLLLLCISVLMISYLFCFALNICIFWNCIQTTLISKLYTNSVLIARNDSKFKYTSVETTGAIYMRLLFIRMFFSCFSLWSILFNAALLFSIFKHKKSILIDFYSSDKLIIWNCLERD